jgi:hypothetical protein
VFGGIGLSSVLGWWVTESTKVPVTFTEGEFAGRANPADIRGSYTFSDIANSFEVSPDILARAFGIQEGDPAAFEVKELEALYADSEYEVGTASVRLFVAYYTGLPFDTTDQDIYLPQSATAILLARTKLTPEQSVYLETHTAMFNPSIHTEQPVQRTPSALEGTTPITSQDYTVKGKTTFGELITWRVSQSTIEQLIGAPMPDPAITLKDYSSANGLDFETLKAELQLEVDRLNP